MTHLAREALNAYFNRDREALERAIHNLEKRAMHNIQSPRGDDCAIESEIQRKGKTAPRVTPADIEANIASEHYFTAATGAGAYAPEPIPDDSSLHLLTFCVLVLRNGFTVTGESACASPENFDAEIGRKIARENAKQKIWSLMGYQLRQELHEAAQMKALHQNPNKDEVVVHRRVL